MWWGRSGVLYIYRSAFKTHTILSTGALRLQGSLGALEGNVRRLVGFAIADCAVDPAARSQLARAGTQGQ